jgi:hypothetical protein
VRARRHSFPRDHSDLPLIVVDDLARDVGGHHVVLDTVLREQVPERFEPMQHVSGLHAGAGEVDLTLR